MKQFKKVHQPSGFQLKIANAVNLKLIQLNDNYPNHARKIVFTESYTRLRKSKWKNSPKPRSLQRRLLNSALFDLSKIFLPNITLLDVAGGYHYGLFMGLKPKNISVLNIIKSEEATYLEDIEGACESVPRSHFDCILCLNYLLLAKSPYKVIENITSFLNGNGIAVLDFLNLATWYLGNEGRHWHLYNPSFIVDILGNHFSDYVIIPVGNCMQASINYYSKNIENRVIKYILRRTGLWFCIIDHKPNAAIHYLVIAKK